MSARRQARADSATLTRSPEGLPPEFALGRCIEVWGSGDGNALSAHSRFSHGRAAYAASVGLESGSPAYSAAFKGGAPWSVAYMIASGRAAQVEARFAAAGVKMSDIPRLQRVAQSWVEGRVVLCD